MSNSRKNGTYGTTKNTKPGGKILFKEDRVADVVVIKTLNEMYDLFLETWLDCDFQRWFRWTSKRCKEFFTSVITGLGNVEIKLVSIDDALEYSKEINDHDSMMYFTSIKNKGYKYISLDGNSRTTFSALFVSGFTKRLIDNVTGPKWDIHSKKYDLKFCWDYNFLPEDKEFTKTIALMTKKSKNTLTYPSFALYQIKDEQTIKKQNLFKYNNGSKKIELDDNDISNLIEMYEFYTSNIKFNIEVWKNITKPEMHSLFIHYNKNEEINQQDIRNAIDCGMSKTIRNIPKSLKDCLETKMTPTSLIKRAHHEMLGYCMYYLQHETPLKNGSRQFNPAGLDLFWEETRDSKFSSFENDIWNTFVKLANTQVNSLNGKPLFLDIFAIAKWIVQHNIATSIIDADKDGWEKVMRIHAEWMEEQSKQGDIYVVGKGKGDWNAYRGGIKYFTFKDKNSNIIEWSDSLERFFSNKLKNREVDFFIIKDDRSSNVNTPTIRLSLWNKQSEIDTLTGELIPFKDVYNTDRNNGYEVDHIDPLDNGGTNDFDNLRLIAGIPNAKKGKKLNYQLN